MAYTIVRSFDRSMFYVRTNTTLIVVVDLSSHSNFHPFLPPFLFPNISIEYGMQLSIKTIRLSLFRDERLVITFQDRQEFPSPVVIDKWMRK